MQTFETPEPISVTLAIGAGEVRILAGERADTTVDVRPSNPDRKADIDAARDTTVDYSKGVLVVEGPKGWKQWMPWGGDGSVDVVIGLPQDSVLRGSAGLCTLTCSGRLASCAFKTGAGRLRVDDARTVELKTAAGDIEVGHVSGDANLTTASGAVRADRIDGSAVVKNVNGDTVIDTVGGDLRVSAANGRVVVEHSSASVVLKTAKGDLTLGDVAGGHVEATTAYGRVDVAIRDGVAAWLDLNTSYGRVRNDLDASERPPAGDVSAEVRARTSFGDITVRRSGVAAA